MRIITHLNHVRHFEMMQFLVFETPTMTCSQPKIFRKLCSYFQQMDEKLCECKVFWDESMGMEVIDFMCDPCHASNGDCYCSREERCRFCLMRPLFHVSTQDHQRATQMLMECIKYHETLREKYKAGTYQLISECSSHESCICDACMYENKLDLETNAGRIRLRFLVDVDDNHDFYEYFQWFQSWQSKNPNYLDPSKWCFSRTLRMVWNARRTEGV